MISDLSVNPDHAATDEDLARDDGGDEALREMADAVVVIARQMKRIAHPEAQRHLGVGVVSADHQNGRVNDDQGVGERRQRETAIGGHQDDEADDGGEDLQQPGEVVVRMNQRPDEDCCERDEERGIRARHEYIMGMNDLFAAVRSGSVDDIRAILKESPDSANARDADGATPLHYAAERGDREMVVALLAAGADINARDGRFGATPAGWAIEYLRERGALLGTEISDVEHALARGDTHWVDRFVTRLPALGRLFRIG